METTRKVIARVLALAAVCAAFIAVYLVYQAAKSTDDDKGPNHPSKQNQSGGGKKKPPKDVPKVYVVKSGDTLGKIKARFGVPIATMVKLNPGLDAQSLSIGQEIKLR